VWGGGEWGGGRREGGRVVMGEGLRRRVVDGG